MAVTALGENQVNTNGNLPAIGTMAPNFNLVDISLGRVSLDSFLGSRVVLNIFPSIDTSTCATSVRQFNQLAANLENTKVLNISRDLPFAQKRFCGVEGIENALCLSDFVDGSFGNDYGVHLLDGKLAHLHARAVVVVDEAGKVIYTELVGNIHNEPNYDAALEALK